MVEARRAVRNLRLPPYHVRSYSKVIYSPNLNEGGDPGGVDIVVNDEFIICELSYAFKDVPIKTIIDFLGLATSGVTFEEDEYFGIGNLK